MTMVEALPIICAVVAVILSGIGLYATSRRNNRKDDSHEATQLTTVIVKLENIGMAVGDIKGDLKDIRTDIRDSRDRLLKCEQEISHIKSQLASAGITKDSPTPQ